MSLSLHLLAALAVVATTSASAQETEGPAATAFRHADQGQWWLSGQVNVITQVHAPFSAAYSGANSFGAGAQAATSYVATVSSGLQLTPLTEVILHVESSAGNGLSDALGLAGFTNLDVVRNPSLGSVPYVARLLVRQIIPLSATQAPAARGPLGVAASLPVRRLEIRAGKMSTADLFDVNAVGSDSHLQFTNWTICNNGAYDYAADTRGYTPGIVIEYQDAAWAARFGEMMMPSVANGIDYDTDVAAARAENLEVELRHRLLSGRSGVVRLLGYLNHARMGSYAEAIQAFRGGADPTPDITAHRHRGATKAGFGLNLEQELSPDLRAFARLGWNDGLNESFAYTEVDDTAAVGADLRGRAWGRAQDKVGAALVTNGLSALHREYLALGGAGFILGDGGLRYGRESILEAYYAALLANGLTVSGGLQAILNPGYNQDRGPVVVVLALRVHLEL